MAWPDVSSIPPYLCAQYEFPSTIPRLTIPHRGCTEPSHPNRGCVSPQCPPCSALQPPLLFAFAVSCTPALGITPHKGFFLLFFFFFFFFPEGILHQGKEPSERQSECHGVPPRWILMGFPPFERGQDTEHK